MQKNKKNFIIWFRAKSTGKIKIDKLEPFKVVSSDEFGNKEEINISSSNIFKVNQAPTRFELWFNVDDALTVGFYPTIFKFINFHIPVFDESGHPTSFDIQVFKVKSDGETYHDVSL